MRALGGLAGFVYESVAVRVMAGEGVLGRVIGVVIILLALRRALLPHSIDRRRDVMGVVTRPYARVVWAVRYRATAKVLVRTANAAIIRVQAAMPVVLC